jgi:hypothetical protein
VGLATFFLTRTALADVRDLRAHRVAPFLMARAGRRHLAIYEPFDRGVLIARIVHDGRDIEAIVARAATAMAGEVAALRRRLANA